MEYMQLASGLVLISLIPIIVSCNILVLMLLSQIALNKRKYRIFNFMYWLSLADIGVALLSVLPGVVEEFNNNRQPISTNAFCKTQRFVQAAVLFSSVYIKLALGFDRYIFLMKVGNRESKIWKLFSNIGAFRVNPSGLCSISIMLAILGASPQIFVWQIFKPVTGISSSITTLNTTITANIAHRYADMCYLALSQNGRRVYNLYFCMAAFIMPLIFYIFSWSHIICTLYPGRIQAPPSPFVQNRLRRDAINKDWPYLTANGQGNSTDKYNNSSSDNPHRPRSASSVTRAATHFRKRGSQILVRLLHWSSDSSAAQQTNEGIDDGSHNGVFASSEDEVVDWNCKDQVCARLREERVRFIANCNVISGVALDKTNLVTRQDCLQSQLRRARRKATKMTVVTIVTYILCWTPYSLATLYIAVDFHSYNSSSMKGIVKVGALLFSLNSCTNPWIYLVFSRSLRHAFKTILSKPMSLFKCV